MSRSFKAVFGAALVALAGVQPTAGLAQSRSVVAAGEQPRMINLPRGTSFAVDLPGDARDVIVSNPQVAEAMLHSPRRITVIGLAPGETDAVFLDAAGRTILALRVRVDAGTSALQDTLSRVVPGSDIRAEAVNDSIILTGTAASPADAARAQQVARAFVSAPEKVMNMISVAGSDQVTLRVRVVEIQRNAIKQLGFDTSALFGQLGNTQFLLGQAATFAVNGGLLGGFTGGYSRDTTQNYQMQGPCAPGLPADTTCPFTVRGPADASNWDTAQPGTGPGSDGLNKSSATIKEIGRAHV